MLDQLLAPLDYPRAALYGLGRSAYRIGTGEGGWEDILGALPGMAGVAGSLVGGPMGGILAGGLTQGLGKLTGMDAFNSPTPSALLEALGADPESPWTHVGAGALHMATDPLMMMGAFKTGNALRGLVPEAEALSPIASGTLGGRVKLPPMLAPMAEESPLAKMLAPETLQAAPEASAQTSPLGAMLEMQTGRGQLPGMAARPLPGMPAADPLPPGPASLGTTLSPERIALQNYPANVGHLHDQMADMLAQGYATPEQRLGVQQATTSLLDDVERFGGTMHPERLPPLSQKELQALMMREAMAKTEASAAEYISPQALSDNPLLDELTFRGGNHLLGNELDELMRRGAMRIPASPTHPAVAQQMASARLASPELQLAERQARGLNDLSQGLTGPQETAALVEELRRYGVPIDPASVVQRYTGYMNDAPFDIAEAAESLAAHGYEHYNPAAVGNELVENVISNRASQLLKMIGPQRMQQLAEMHPPPTPGGLESMHDAAHVLGHGWQRALPSELERLLVQRGLLPQTQVINWPPS